MYAHAGGRLVQYSSLLHTSFQYFPFWHFCLFSSLVPLHSRFLPADYYRSVCCVCVSKLCPCRTVQKQMKCQQCRRVVDLKRDQSRTACRDLANVVLGFQTSCTERRRTYIQHMLPDKDKRHWCTTCTVWPNSYLWMALRVWRCMLPGHHRGLSSRVQCDRGLRKKP